MSTRNMQATPSGSGLKRSATRTLPQVGNRSGPRSKDGCWTCRRRKVKCDEQRPHCQKCTRSKRPCDYASREGIINPRKHSSFLTTTTRADTRNITNKESVVRKIGDLPSRNLSSSSSPQLEIERVSVDSLQNPAEPISDDSDLESTKAWALSLPESSTLSGSAIDSPILGPMDYEAIEWFRTVFSLNMDTKDPRYSVPSVVLRLAEGDDGDPMVLRMICALGVLAVNNTGEDNGNLRFRKLSCEHYSSAMNLMRHAVAGHDDSLKLDNILATLWLMIIYEQKFGDDNGNGLISHLKGAASILQSKCQSLQTLLTSQDGRTQAGQIIPYIQTTGTSAFAARMIVWMSFLDAGAMSCGLGGQINSSLGQLLSAESDYEWPLKGFSAVHRYSTMLFRNIWGDEYPQSQLLEDLENRQLFYLYGECGQLRYMVGKLGRLHHTNEAEARKHRLSVQNAVESVATKYEELLEVARTLSARPNDTRTFVTNIRFVVSYYHSAILHLRQVSQSRSPYTESEKVALRDIVILAFQAYRQDGDQAMLRVAWPLFLAAQETDDPVHCQWIVERFKALSKYGRNYKRAFKLLEALLEAQAGTRERVAILRLLESGRFEKFVI